MTLSSRQGPGNANQSTTRPAKYLAAANVSRTLPTVVTSTGNHFNQQALQFSGSTNTAGNTIYIGRTSSANSAANWSATGQNSQDGGSTGNLWLQNAGQVTIEGWFYFTTIPAAATGIVEYGGNGFTLAISSNVSMYTAKTGQGYSLTFTWSPTTGLYANTWTHIAWQRSYAANGNPYQSAWINGNIANNTANTPNVSYNVYTGTNPNSSANTPYIGGAVGSNYLNAQVQEFRISNIARYNQVGNLTVPTSTFVNDNNTLLLIHGNSATTDDNS
jgi:hypothetical protein